MNIANLLTQEPFGKWSVKFLRSYVKDADVYISKIGSRAFSTDIEIINMFMSIMIRDHPGGAITVPDLEMLFNAWYAENSTYHTNYRPPRMELIRILRQKYEYRLRVRDGYPGFIGVKLVVATVEETLELVASESQRLQYQLPDFEPEIDRDLERAMDLLLREREEYDGTY